MLNKKDSRKKRHRSLRKRVNGTSERPRLAVFRSTRHIYAQVIDDLDQKTLVSAADRDLLGQTAAKVRELRPPEPYKGKGVKYVEEVIQRKVGKAGATSGG